MATSLQKSSFFIPMIPREKKLQSLLFNIPNSHLWDQCTNVINFDNSRFIQWCEKGKGLVDSEHRIIFESKLIERMDFVYALKKSGQRCFDF